MPAVRRGHSSGRCSSDIRRVSEHLMKLKSPDRTAISGVRPTLTGTTFGSIRTSACGPPLRPPRLTLCLSPPGGTPVQASYWPPFLPSVSVRTGARALRGARMPMASSNRRRSELETPRNSDTAGHPLGFYCGPLPLATSAQRPRSSTPPRDSKQGDERDESANSVAPSALPASLVGRPSTRRITSGQPFGPYIEGRVLAAPPNPACSGLAALAADARR
jgi:hypothetical protein